MKGAIMEEVAPEPIELPDKKLRLAEIAGLRGEAALRAFVQFVLDLEGPLEEEGRDDAAVQTAVG